jgi:hypothetical protein
MVKSWSYPQELSAVSTEKSVSLESSEIGDRSCKYGFGAVGFGAVGFFTS